MIVLSTAGRRGRRPSASSGRSRVWWARRALHRWRRRHRARLDDGVSLLPRIEAADVVAGVDWIDDLDRLGEGADGIRVVVLGEHDALAKVRRRHVGEEVLQRLWVVG